MLRCITAGLNQASGVFNASFYNESINCPSLTNSRSYVWGWWTRKGRGANKVPDMGIDPKRVVGYEEVVQYIHRPEKVIIDVRNPEEIRSTGKIPSSINIPLNTVDQVLTSMSDEEFLRRYHRSKPTNHDELIFYCKSGRRSSEALSKALRHGYTNSKTFLGGWEDWSKKHRHF